LCGCVGKVVGLLVVRFSYAKVGSLLPLLSSPMVSSASVVLTLHTSSFSLYSLHLALSVDAPAECGCCVLGAYASANVLAFSLSAYVSVYGCVCAPADTPDLNMNFLTHPSAITCVPFLLIVFGLIVLSVAAKPSSNHAAWLRPAWCLWLCPNCLFHRHNDLSIYTYPS
jgi:hypothetical protein